METKLAQWSLIFLLGIASAGCVHDPILPPEEPLTPVPDCSNSFTEAVQDTIWTLPPEGPGGMQTDHYLGYEIQDISFNPRDPNELAVAIYVHDGYEDLLGYDHGMLLMVYNLCTGQKTILKEPTDQFPYVHSIDWGHNGLLLFGTNANWTTPEDISVVLTMKSNGDSIVKIPHHRLGIQVTNVKWSWNDRSILVSSSFHSETEIDFQGNDISTDLGVPNNSDLLYKSASELLFIGATVGMLNQSTSIITTYGNSDTYSGNRDIALTGVDSALFWSSGSEIVLHDFESSVTTTIKEYETWKESAFSASTSTNGYLAYVIKVSSSSLTTSSNRSVRDEIRFINPDGSNERRLILNFD